MLKVECLTVRLACVKHAASVRPEPGSNSPYLIYEEPFGSFLLCFCLRFTEGLLFSYPCGYFHSAFQFISLFSFQGTLAPPLEATLLYYHSRSDCVNMFFKFK